MGFLATVILGDLLVDVDGPSSTAAVVERTGVASAAHHPVAAAMTIITAVLLVVAGLAFLHGRRDARLEDRLLAGAAFFLAGAELQYLAMPVVATDWVTPRDGLRLAAYLLVVASAFTRYMKTRDDQARAAISSERERIARDLHDGLAQDLACIATQSQRLGREARSRPPVAACNPPRAGRIARRDHRPVGVRRPQHRSGTASDRRRVGASLRPPGAGADRTRERVERRREIWSRPAAST